MVFNIRPSKVTFHKYFSKFIINSRDNGAKTVLDIGCSNAPNIRSFPDMKYTGADLRSDFITANKLNYSGQAVEFVEEDLTNLRSLNGKKFDLVTSTHTMASIPPDKKLAAAKNLSSLVKKEGALIVQVIAEDSTILNELKPSFKTVEVINYRGALSQNFENYLMKRFKLNMGETRNIIYQKNKFLLYFILSFSYLISLVDVFGEKDQSIYYFKSKIQ